MPGRGPSTPAVWALGHRGIPGGLKELSLSTGRRDSKMPQCEGRYRGALAFLGTGGVVGIGPGERKVRSQRAWRSNRPAPSGPGEPRIPERSIRASFPDMCVVWLHTEHTKLLSLLLSAGQTRAARRFMEWSIQHDNATTSQPEKCADAQGNVPPIAPD